MMISTTQKIGLISALVFAQCAFAQVTMDIVGKEGARVNGGSVKLTPQIAADAFYLINDDDDDGTVELVDWNGNPLKSGDYIIEIRGKDGSIIRTGEVRIADNRVYEDLDGVATEVKATETSSDGVNPVVVGGLVGTLAIVGALAASGRDDNGNGGGTPPDDTTDVDMSGPIDCQVTSDENNHAPIIGTVGGASNVRVQSGSMRLNMPVSGATAFFTGTYGSGEFSVTEYATVGGFPNTEMKAQGNFSPDTGTLDFVLNIGSNGSFNDETGQVGTTYACSGTVTSNN